MPARFPGLAALALGLTLATLAGAPLSAATASLVADVNPTFGSPADRVPSFNLVPFGDRVLFEVTATDSPRRSG